MIWIAVFIVTIYFGIQLFSLVSILQHTDKKIAKRKEYPKVSILLAARNEEALIIRNLTAIEALNYP